MAQNQVGIINRALTRAASARITSISDPVKAAKSMDAVYVGERDSAQMGANWKEFITRFNPAQHSSTPLFGYQYEYQVPADCLRIIEIQGIYVGTPNLGPRYLDESPKTPYTLEGSKILTDFNQTLKCRGIFRNTNEGTWGVLFIDYFMHCLICATLVDLSRKGQGDIGLAEDLKQQAFDKAVMMGAIEKPPEEIPDTSWIMSRVGP